MVHLDCIADCIVTYRDLLCPCRARVGVACAGRIQLVGQMLDVPGPYHLSVLRFFQNVLKLFSLDFEMLKRDPTINWLVLPPASQSEKWRPHHSEPSLKKPKSSPHLNIFL